MTNYSKKLNRVGEKKFIEQNGIRITPFTYVINEKLKMIEDSSTKKDERHKHAEDLSFLTMRFNLIADE